MSLDSDSSDIVSVNGDDVKIHFYAASGGNAGIACVHAAILLGYPATVVIPRASKPTMITRLWAMGATNVILHGGSIAEAQEHIHTTLLPQDPSGIFVPPFDHEDVWDGNATVMREIVEQLGGAAPDVVVCSVGGGGLMNGIMQVIDEQQSADKVQVVAMETDGADSLHQSLKAGKLITLPKITSQATSLGVVRVAQKTFDYAQRSNVTSVVLPDSEAARGCCLLAEHERMMVELTVGVNIPICYGGMLQRLLGNKKLLNRDSTVVIVVCGGNDICIDYLVAWREAMLAEDMREKMIDSTQRMATAKVSA